MHVGLPFIHFLCPNKQSLHIAQTGGCAKFCLVVALAQPDKSHLFLSTQRQTITDLFWSLIFLLLEVELGVYLQQNVLCS